MIWQENDYMIYDYKVTSDLILSHINKLLLFHT